MVSCQVAAQKFLPCNNTAVLLFGAAGFTSMYAISRASPCDVKEKCDTGQGYSNPSNCGPSAGSSSAATIGEGAPSAMAAPRQSTRGKAEKRMIRSSAKERE